MEVNENQIIAQCIDGNWSGFDQIYDQYLPKIYRYVYYRTSHKQTSEDITQTVFLKVVKNIRMYRQNTSFQAWIYSIAHNALIDHMRSIKPTADLEQAKDFAGKDDVAGEAERAINLGLVKQSLDQLTDLQKEIVILRVWDDLSHAQIAAMLNISEDSSKMNFSRALASLKQKVASII